MSVIYHLGTYLRPPWHITPWYTILSVICRETGTRVVPILQHITLNMVYHGVICHGGRKYVPKWYIMLIHWYDWHVVQRSLWDAQSCKFCLLVLGIFLTLFGFLTKACHIIDSKQRTSVVLTMQGKSLVSFKHVIFCQHCFGDDP